MIIFAFAAAFVMFLSCSGKNSKLEGEKIREVRAVPVIKRELIDKTGGFGTISYLTKIDISAPQEGLLAELFCREGDSVKQGERLFRLSNPQIELAVAKAANDYAQAEAALELARSRLLEGEFQTEAEVLGIDKGEAELEQARRSWEEEKRKFADQEKIFEAGGVSEETMRQGRFTLEAEWEQIHIMEKELELRRVGLRDGDLVNAGLPAPKNDSERLRLLVNLRTASLRAEVQAALAMMEGVAKELESARLALADLMVISPGGGVVGARYFEKGERLKREDKVLTLMDTSAHYAIFPVRESEALRISRGMNAAVRLDGSGETYEGLVDLVYPQADSQSQSFLVRVLLDVQSKELRPGMFARVSVLLGPPRRSIVINESCLVNKNDNEALVFVIKDNCVSERKLNLGQALDGEWEILGGLREGEIVVLEPEADLREGEYVQLAE
jgi:multidrug efflux pump subunit AcrA (membrane-fusion protein)